MLSVILPICSGRVFCLEVSSDFGYNKVYPYVPEVRREMSAMFTAATTDFFLDLRYHNSKSFMDANRERYLRQVREPFYAFIGALAPAVLTIDPEMETRPNRCLSRINRDIRFTKDKSPYRDHLWVAFRASCVGKDGVPFFWFELSPESTGWGVGIWGENRSAMDAMRRRMTAAPREFLPVLKSLADRGFRLAGDEWKKLRVPDEIPEALAPWYRKKEIYAERALLPAAEAFRDDLTERVKADYLALTPFYRILRGAAAEEAEQ